MFKFFSFLYFISAGSLNHLVLPTANADATAIAIASAANKTWIFKSSDLENTMKTPCTGSVAVFIYCDVSEPVGFSKVLHVYHQWYFDLKIAISEPLSKLI